MKQKNCIWAVAATMLLAAASFTSCYKQDNVIYPEPETAPDYSFDEGSIIQNGMCENLTDVKYYWVNIGQDGGEYTGPATIKWDEETPKNHCVIVDARSESDARAAGNFGAQTWADPTKYADHDTQFFITFGEENALKEKDQIRITMDIKAEEDFTAGTGAHAAPGAYLSNGIGNVPFTTDWTNYDSGFVTISKQQAGTYSIAFNLANTNKDEANRFFFDNIRVEVIRFIPDPEPVQIEGMKVVFWNWGVAKDNQFSVKYFKNYTAPVAEDGAIVVESLDPDKVYTEYYNFITENNVNKETEAKVSVDWDTQFLISLPEPLAKDTKVKLVLKVKADKAATADVQAHKVIPAPGAIEGKDGYEGTYLHYDLLGLPWGQSFNFTTEWTTFEKDFTVPAAADGMQSICFNLEKLREVNKYYFDDITVYVEKGEEPTWVIDYANPKGQDGSPVTGYPYYRMGGNYDVEDGVLVIKNETELANNWDSQPYIIDWVSLKPNSKYKVRITMAASADGKANLHYGNWGSGHMDNEFSFTGGEQFKAYDIEFENSNIEGNGDVHICFQSGKFVGTIKIKKVEIFEE